MIDVERWYKNKSDYIDEDYGDVLRDEILKNDEKVLGKIPSVRIFGREWRVFVTTKRLIFDNSSICWIEPISDQERAINDLSYANITKVKFKRYWGDPNYYLFIWGFTKKMKEKKLITGCLDPLYLYLKDKKLLGFSEKKAARDYAIETENLLTSVLKDKIVKGVGLQNNASFVQPSRYFSYPKLQERDKEVIADKIREKAKRQKKAEEKIAKILKDAKPNKLERAKTVAVGILFISLGVIMTICGFWLVTSNTPWVSLAGHILWICGMILIMSAIIGPILGGI